MKSGLKILWVLSLSFMMLVAFIQCGSGPQSSSSSNSSSSNSSAASNSSSGSSPTLVSIAVYPANPSVPIGTSLQFTATGTFSDGTTQDVTNSVIWSSSVLSVATIVNTPGSSATGTATAVALGTTTIKATSGGIQGSSVLTSIKLVSLSVTPANPSIAVGNTQQFTATGTFSDKSTQDVTTLVTWSSSTTSVVTISNKAGSTGMATAVTTGSTTITAGLDGISISTTLTVTTATLVSITVTPSAPSASISLGSNLQFTAIGTYSDGSKPNLTASVIWSSSAPSVATISNVPGSQGNATSVAAGSTTITATLGSISNSVALKITSPTVSTPSSYSTPAVAVLPSSIAIDYAGNIWATNFGGNSLSMLPTALTFSGGAVTSPIPAPTIYPLNGASPFGIAIDYLGDIWTANYNSGTVSMLNLNQPPIDQTYCPFSQSKSPGPFLYSFGPADIAPANQPLNLYGPHGIVIDSSNNVWVTNYGGNTVTKFTPFYSFCTLSATSPYLVTIPTVPLSFAVGTSPYGIAIDASGNAWVTNSGDNTVTEIPYSGLPPVTITPVDLSGNQQLNVPLGIAIDSSGNIWVANSGSSAVTELNSNGSWIGTFNPVDLSGNKQLNVPHSIAIETSGNVWVTNFGNTSSPGNTVTKLCGSNTANCPPGSSTGSLLGTFTVGNNPEGIVIDFWGNVWVTNYYANTVTVWKGATNGPHFSPYSGPIWP